MRNGVGMGDKLEELGKSGDIEQIQQTVNILVRGL